MKCCRFLLNVRDKDSISSCLVTALNDHDAQASTALVHPNLSSSRKLGELLAFKNLNGKKILNSLLTQKTSPHQGELEGGRNCLLHKNRVSFNCVRV